MPNTQSPPTPLGAHGPQEPHRTPLAASGEPPRLILLPNVAEDSGGPVCGLATGHPRRQHIRMFWSMAAALAALSSASGRSM
jgi:hypothetical protein